MSMQSTRKKIANLFKTLKSLCKKKILLFDLSFYLSKPFYQMFKPNLFSYRNVIGTLKQISSCNPFLFYETHTHTHSLSLSSLLECSNIHHFIVYSNVINILWCSSNTIMLNQAQRNAHYELVTKQSHLLWLIIPWLVSLPQLLFFPNIYSHFPSSP